MTTRHILHLNSIFDGLVRGTSTTYNIYGKPELTDRGQGSNVYNNDSEFRYTNTFEGVLSDGRSDTEGVLTGLNSYGSKCATIVLGSDTQNEYNRPHLRNLFDDLGLSSVSADGVIVAELVKPESFIYTGGLYGGNSVEERSRTKYVEIGAYVDFSKVGLMPQATSFVGGDVVDGGDTYRQTFNLARVSKTDTEVYSINNSQITEVVSFPVETSINLNDRSDESSGGWDSNFQPRYYNYHDYNEVYSQQETLGINFAEPFDFKTVKEFDNRLMITNTKVSGETIDSWTEFLTNELLDLDGRYGEITALQLFDDEVYAFQDAALSYVAINPRVQTQASDGVSIELGKGSALYDFKTISNKSGTKNKASVIVTPSAMYFVDILNNTINKFSKNGKDPISKTKNLDSFMRSNIEYNNIKQNNPLNKKGALAYADTNTGDVSFTFLQDNPFTITYNERIDQFVSFDDVKPVAALGMDSILLQVSDDGASVYRAYEGNYGEFFNITYDTAVDRYMSPASSLGLVNFSKIKYVTQTELTNYQENIIQTLRVYNDYQDTGNVQVLTGRGKMANLRDREWTLTIPRELGKRNRIKSRWAMVQLSMTNDDNISKAINNLRLTFTI